MWITSSNDLQEFHFKYMKSWDKVHVTNNDSEDAIAFTLFQIIQGNKLIDLVLEENCGISWFDVNDSQSNECYD